MRTLGFGLGHAVPDTATAAWGARLIINMDGGVDFLHDRTDFVYEDEDAKASLRDKLESVAPFSLVRDIIREKILGGEIHTRVEADVVLLDRDGLKIVANSNASCGYLYVAAFETSEVKT